MAASTQSPAAAPDEGPTDERPPVTVCESRPDRYVFIETGNRDAWIASDRTVEPARYR